MAETTALQFVHVKDGDYEGVEERDVLIAVEVADPEAERSIDLHLGPRTAEVVSCSLSADEAWRLARELARCATEAESHDG